MSRCMSYVKSTSTSSFYIPTSMIYVLMSISTSRFLCSDVDDVCSDVDVDIGIDVVCLMWRRCLICPLIAAGLMHFKLDTGESAPYSVLPPGPKDKAKPLYVDKPGNALMNDFGIFLMDQLCTRLNAWARSRSKKTRTFSNSWTSHTQQLEVMAGLRYQCSMSGPRK